MHKMKNINYKCLTSNYLGVLFASYSNEEDTYYTYILF